MSPAPLERRAGGSKPFSPRFPPPRIVVSRCLELAACRYDGAAIRAPLVRRLERHAELVPVCPEVEIGLGVPRDPVRLCAVGGALRMVQPATGRDLTEATTGFADSFLSRLGPVEGFILKSRSPSCGLVDTKVFADAEATHPEGKGAGLFARAVLERFGDTAVEDEERLTHFRPRHHFLAKAFTLARLRRVEEAGATGDLAAFHADLERLLTIQHAAAARRLGRIAAHPERRPFPEALAAYRAELARAFARPVRRSGLDDQLALEPYPHELIRAW